jgi:hypothetical protein
MTLPVKPIFIRIGRRRYQVADFKQASEMYSAARDRALFAGRGGASRIPPATIVDECGDFVASISYNGRVWASRDFVSGDVPLYDNRVQS